MSGMKIFINHAFLELVKFFKKTTEIMLIGYEMK